MILVTGGTGLVGRAVVKELLDSGFKVKCLVRNPEKALLMLGEAPEYAPGDITDYASVRKAASGAEGVIHLVATIRERGDRTFKRINVDGTVNTVQAAVDAGVKRFIHMSAIGVREGPAYRYAHSKWQGEEAVRNSGLDWTIIKPSLIYGPGFGFFDRMAQSVRTSPPPFVAYPAGKTLFQPIAAPDVARCVVAALKKPDAVRRVYEIGGPEHLTYAEMLGIYLDVNRIRRIKLPVPVFLLRLAVPLMEKLLPDPPVTSVELKQMDIDIITDPDAVKKNFGFEPVRLRDGLSSQGIS
ncbi:MAG: complex I NDUFA9 subunit family protein [Bacillota bacterium]